MGFSSKKDLLNKTKKQFYQEVKKYQKELPNTKEIEGFPATAIVGEKGYPNLKVHNVSNSNKEASFFNNSETVKKNYEEILPMKARNILGSTDTMNVRKVDDRIKKEVEDVYKAKKPVEIHSEFEKELKFNKVLVDKFSGIVGSKNPLEKLYATENTPTSEKVEKFTASDVKAKDAVINLYRKNVNEHQIMNLLSFGSLGSTPNRKLVPSKWAISAYDNMVENNIYEKIKYFPTIENIEVYSYSDKGNYFVIILFPSFYYCSILESFPGAVKEDFTDAYNKLDKKSPDTAGGYWATKLPILEHLKRRKRQASFMSIRIIKDYEIPLGVVFVREAVREAMKNKIFDTNSEKELNQFLSEKYIEEKYLFENSKFNKKRNEKSLKDFF